MGKPRRVITHCPQGHAYDEMNTYTAPDGRRSCHACRKIQARASTQKRRTYVQGWRDQKCPICGDGWFVNAGVHVQKVHGATLRGLVSASFSYNARTFSEEHQFGGEGPKKARKDYWKRWASAALEEIAIGGYYVERLAKRWRLTRQGASSRLMRLEERGLIQRPRPRNRSLRSEKDPRTRCLHGHKLTQENTYERDGIRRCRICLKAQAHAAYERRKARGYYNKS